MEGPLRFRQRRAQWDPYRVGVADEITVGRVRLGVYADGFGNAMHVDLLDTTPLIFTGSPGAGKTVLARTIASQLAGVKVLALSSHGRESDCYAEVAQVAEWSAAPEGRVGAPRRLDGP